MLRQFRLFASFILLAVLTVMAPLPVAAQEGGTLSLSTPYPSLVIGVGETLTIDVDIHSTVSQVVALDVANVPDGWTIEFRGGGRTIRSVYVDADSTANIKARVEPPEDVQAGTYTFQVVARSGNEEATLPVELVVREKAPAQLTLSTDFPTIRGTSDTTFRYSVTLKNEGDEEITANLVADAPADFLVTFKSAGKDITSLPIAPGSSKRLDVSVEPIADPPAGSYQVMIYAQGGDVEASLPLVAEVVGRPNLDVTTPDGRLSGDVYLGRENTINLVVRNQGSAPAIGVQVSASAPAGWTVTMDPEQIDEIAAGDEVNVTATVKPAEKAVAGDYIITFRASPTEGATDSTEYRVTVRASTLWGLVGVALIAVAIGVVALAVTRFGRR
ncbi:MAG: hypothetical protein D6770_03090 [Anaerolineae bacterium]|nr:MAG: hypothetical protein D6770_03090 [Anaerolineae bacterium]